MPDPRVDIAKQWAAKFGPEEHKCRYVLRATDTSGNQRRGEGYRRQDKFWQRRSEVGVYRRIKGDSIQLEPFVGPCGAGESCL